MPLRRLLKRLGKRRTPPMPEPTSIVTVEPTFDALAASISTLQNLKDERVFLQVRLPTLGDAVYQSLILDVDSINNRVIIDDLFPRDAGPDITEGVPIDISCRHSGIRLQFGSIIENISLIDGHVAYELRVPTQVEAKQQRKHFRIHVPLDSGIKLMTDVPSVTMASVLNISSTGIGVIVPGNVEEAIRANKTLRNCRLQLPMNLNVICTLHVRSVQFKSKPTRRTILGGELADISSIDQKKLDQYVFSQQRLQRQREMNNAVT